MISYWQTIDTVIGSSFFGRHYRCYWNISLFWRNEKQFKAWLCYTWPMFDVSDFVFLKALINMIYVSLNLYCSIAHPITDTIRNYFILQSYKTDNGYWVKKENRYEKSPCKVSRYDDWGSYNIETIISSSGITRDRYEGNLPILEHQILHITFQLILKKCTEQKKMRIILLYNFISVLQSFLNCGPRRN